MAKDNRPGAAPKPETYERQPHHKQAVVEVHRLPFETDEEFEERGGKLPRGGGRRERFNPSALVRIQAAMAWAAGATDAMVGAMLGIDRSTATERLALEKAEAVQFRNMALSNVMVRKAMQGDTAMLIFLAKNWLGMKDRVDNTSGDQPLPLPDAAQRSLNVVYVFPSDPRANPGPPPELMGPVVESTAVEAS